VIGWLLGIALAGTPELALADVRTELADDAWMNWSTMRIEVAGSATDPKLAHDNRPLEQQAIAAVDARIGSVVGALPVRGRSILGDLVPGVEGTVKLTWTVGEGRYFRDGHVEVVGVVEVLPLLASWSRGRATKPPPATLGGKTGLVLDARGLEVAPVFAPRVVSPGGAVLYDSVLSSDAAFEQAPVVWVSDPAHPAAVRAGTEPLLLGVDNAYGGDLVLSEAAAGRVARAFDQSRVLGDGTVVVVIDP
jgi:hypothetical protein